MGHIKEPEGVDFVINSRPLTKSEELAISQYILNYRVKNSATQTTLKPARRIIAKKKVLA